MEEEGQELRCEGRGEGSDSCDSCLCAAVESEELNLLKFIPRFVSLVSGGLVAPYAHYLPAAMSYDLGTASGLRGKIAWFAKLSRGRMVLLPAGLLFVGLAATGSPLLPPALTAKKQ